jgi:CelD/BcsL family acetyltransferase involved in cellulose biosynthesis
MEISLARPGELGRHEIARWHCLQATTASLANPFLCPEFAIAVDRVRPDARVAVLCDGPDIAGFFPFQRRRLGVGVPIGTGLNSRQGVIHAPGTEWDAAELLRACKLSAWHFDCLASGQRAFERYAAAIVPAPVIDLTDGFAAYQGRLRAASPKFWKDLSRKTRKLEREAGALHWQVDSPDIGELRTLMRWKSEQYRRSGWIDFFARPWLVDLVDDLFATRGSEPPFGGLLTVLYAGDIPVAMHFGLRYGPVYSGCYPAYDQRFRTYSPGLIQQLGKAGRLAAAGVRLIEMGRGPESYKQTLKNNDLMIAEGMAASGPLVGTAHRARTSAVKWAGPRIRKHPRLLRTADRILCHYGRTT